MALGEKAGFPECRGPSTRGRVSSLEPGKALGEEFLFFSFFALFFLRPFHII
jgi:hypothetical protein